MSKLLLTQILRFVVSCRVLNFLLSIPFFGFCGLIVTLQMGGAELSPKSDSYFAGSFVVGVALLASLRLSHVRCQLVSISTISVICGFYIFETALLLREGPSRPWLSDKQALLERMAALRGQGQDVYMNLQRGNIDLNGTVLFPLSSLADTTIVLCKEADGIIIAKTDRHGFLNPDQLWDRSSLSIVALGDSFTHGYCVPTEKTMISHIRSEYPGTLNLGIAGNGSLLNYAIFQEYVHDLRPRLVIWFYFEYDLQELAGSLQESILTKYLDDPQFRQQIENHRSGVDKYRRLAFDRQLDTRTSESMEAEPVSRHPNVNALTPAAIEFLKLSKTRRRLGFTLYSDVREIDEPVWNVQTEIIRSIKKFVAKWDGTIHMVYLPSHSTFIGAAGEDLRPRLIETVKEQGITVTDIYDVFSQSDDPLKYFAFREFGGHYSVSGYELVSKRVLKDIRRYLKGE